MGSDVVFYARPDGEPRRLGIAPRLAGWMATGHPDQVHVRAFVTHAQSVLGAPPSGPTGLRLDVGLPEDVRLLDQYGLGHYVCPLAEWLESQGGWELASVWAAKAPGEDTVLRVAEARPVPEPEGDRRFTVRTTTSAGSPQFTEQVREQLAGEPALPAGPIALQLAFAVPAGCNWPGLWQPTLDGLAQLLGAAADDSPEEPCDGRVVELGLHRQEDAALDHDVVVTGIARALGDDAGPV
ncbi:hypothetical protein ACI79D_05425 [Geodermatophilus sp. SYSU D00708]